MKTRGILALISALFLVSFANPAAAGVHLEPYVGYGMGDWTAGSNGEDMSGMIFGGRLGYTMLGLGGGVEYMSGNMEDEGTSALTFKPGALGVWVGYTFPVLVRAYATYFWDAKTDVESGANTYEYTGNSIKLGVGFTAMPFLSINLEYMMSTFDEADGTAIANEVESKMYFLTVSIPLDI